MKVRYLFTVWSERPVNQMQTSPGFKQNARELHFDHKLPNSSNEK